MGIFNWLFGKKKSTSSVNSNELTGDQKMVFVIYSKLKGIDFSNVKFGASGNIKLMLHYSPNIIKAPQ